MFLQKITDLNLVIYQAEKTNTRVDGYGREIFRRDVSNYFYTKHSINFQPKIKLNMQTIFHSLSPRFTIQIQLKGVVIFTTIPRIVQYTIGSFTYMDDAEAYKLTYNCDLSDLHNRMIEFKSIIFFLKSSFFLENNIVQSKNDLFKTRLQLQAQLQTLIFLAKDYLISDILTIVNDYLNTQIQKGMIIDCIDGDQKPYPALVLDVDEDDCTPRVLVHYLGWSNYWNIWIDMDSYKLNLRYWLCKRGTYINSKIITEYNSAFPLYLESLAFTKELIFVAANALLTNSEETTGNVVNVNVVKYPSKEEVISLIEQLDPNIYTTTNTYHTETE